MTVSLSLSLSSFILLLRFRFSSASRMQDHSRPHAPHPLLPHMTRGSRRKTEDEYIRTYTTGVATRKLALTDGFQPFSEPTQHGKSQVSGISGGCDDDDNWSTICALRIRLRRERGQFESFDPLVRKVREMRIVTHAHLRIRIRFASSFYSRLFFFFFFFCFTLEHSCYALLSQ